MIAINKVASDNIFINVAAQKVSSDLLRVVVAHRAAALRVPVCGNTYQLEDTPSDVFSLKLPFC